MNVIFKIVGSLFVFTYLLLNYYVGLRSFQAIKSFIPSLNSIIFWPIFFVIATAYILDRIPNLTHPLLHTVGSYWLGAFFYLLVFFLFFDLLGLINSSFSILPSSWTFLWQTKKIYSLSLILTAGILVIGSYMAHQPHIVKYEVQIAKEMSNLKEIKIVMISDLHVEAQAKTDYLEKAAKTISDLNPDLILLAGDIVEGTIDPGTEEKLGRILKLLKASSGIYAVLGNHEYYGGQSDQITAFLEKNHVHTLRDSVTTAMDNRIYIAGREDYGGRHMGSSSRQDLSQILSGTDPLKPLILLDHQPQAVKEAQETGVDLMLSGHTHGGQLFPAQIVTKALFLIDRGIWTEGSFNLIVSTGLGLWGPPLRTNSRSEIAEINVTFTGK